ncbi:hypothetical protein SAMN04487764_1487 [Gillisia sp. Hel1_33_143]|uniref:hypothetical protein n=1 Tax=Gillisia sp. Hel1_33_143 TaxID=1336796 RepID=UPI00087C4D13|nr:hypothetical protein [Gillisia sp. Hel1_33_143]SDS11420.1 hypothetical protein SAMN04487764_1487 [Gillisia sp. Hel1_33_143]
MAKVKNSNQNPESFTISVTEKDGRKSETKHVTEDIVKSWDIDAEFVACNEGYIDRLREGLNNKCQTLCRPMVFLDENGNEQTVWQNIDGSWS